MVTFGSLYREQEKHWSCYICIVNRDYEWMKRDGKLLHLFSVAGKLNVVVMLPSLLVATTWIFDTFQFILMLIKYVLDMCLATRSSAIEHIYTPMALHREQLRVQCLACFVHLSLPFCSIREWNLECFKVKHDLVTLVLDSYTWIVNIHFLI